MQNGQSFAWGALGAGVFVMIHDRDAPSDRDWDGCLEELGAFQRRQALARAVVFTDGGAPSKLQRRRLDSMVGTSPPTSVITDAMVVRFVVASLALMNSSIATFSSSELDAAWKHVGLDREAASRAQSELLPFVHGLDPRFVTVRRALGVR